MQTHLYVHISWGIDENSRSLDKKSVDQIREYIRWQSVVKCFKLIAFDSNGISIHLLLALGRDKEPEIHGFVETILTDTAALLNPENGSTAHPVYWIKEYHVISSTGNLLEAITNYLNFDKWAFICGDGVST